MIPNQAPRNLSSHGTGSVGEFGLSQADAPFIMRILRDKIYTDKKLAVLREYSANAWDANREAGRGDVPIKITMPTSQDPTLSIQDFGLGLSQDDVFKVYTQYGASTKRTSDLTVGCLGIGSKSGFAYSDSFNIISCHGGVRSTYTAVLDDSERGIINLLAQKPCGTKTGVTIQVAIRPVDIPEFNNKALDLYRYFIPRPDINLDIPKLSQVVSVFTHGLIFNDYHNGHWVAVMGCIPYKVDLNQIQGDGAGVGIAKFLHRVSGAMYFGIGEVNISASREELEYSAQTKTALVKKFEVLVDEFVQKTIAGIEGSSMNHWDKRIKSQILHSLHFPVPKNYADYISASVSVPKKMPKEFRVTTKAGLNEPATSISVDTTSRLLIRDDDRTLVGFNLHYHDYLIVTTKRYAKKFQAALDKWLEEMQITGITIQKLSELPWTAPPVKAKKVVDERHKRRTFKLNVNHLTTNSPLSRNWEVVNRIPTVDDVFVVMEHFKVDEIDLYGDLERLQTVMDNFDFSTKLPLIYGYKSTKKKPVKSTDCLGTEYREWKKKFYTDALKDKTLLREMELWVCGNNMFISDIRYNSDRKSNDKVRQELIDNLGKDHIIIDIFEAMLLGQKHVAKISDNWIKRRCYEDFIKLLENSDYQFECLTVLRSTLERYPLFRASSNTLSELWGPSKTEWLHYVKLIDSEVQQPQLAAAGAP